MRAVLILLALLIGLTDMATAQGREKLGWGRMFTNDLIGDGSDRWRTGSYTMNYIRGYGWDGALPNAFGDILEFRARGELVSPRNLANPSPTDRPYAGMLTFGVHTHFERDAVEYSTGLDMVFVGPQTGVFNFTDSLHRIVGAPRPRLPANQLGDAVYPTLVLEAGRTLSYGNFDIRPFAEAQIGVESLVRIGGDFRFGTISRDSLYVRDSISGQRYVGVRGAETGGTLIVGGDLAYVADSFLLPSDQGYDLRAARGRLRAGIHWLGPSSEVFYGLTWLSKEFDAQGSSQFVGSLNVNFQF
jgi:hypothetical protein